MICKKPKKPVKKGRTRARHKPDNWCDGRVCAVNKYCTKRPAGNPIDAHSNRVEKLAQLLFVSDLGFSLLTPQRQHDIWLASGAKGRYHSMAESILCRFILTSKT